MFNSLPFAVPQLTESSDSKGRLTVQKSEPTIPNTFDSNGNHGRGGFE